MRRRLFGLLCLLLFPSSAPAAPVVVLGPHGRVSVRNDPFVSGPSLTPAPPGSTVAARAASARIPARKRGKPKRPERTVVSELTRLYHTHAIRRIP